MARLRLVATCLAAGLTATHLGLWVVIYVELQNQASLVDDLSLIGARCLVVHGLPACC